MHRMKSLLSFGLIAMVIMIVGLLAINAPTTYAAEAKVAAHAKAGEKEALAAVDLVRCQSYSETTDRLGHDIFMCRHNHHRTSTALAKRKYLKSGRSWPLLNPS